MAFNLNDYTDVAERIQLFYTDYPEGRLQTANFQIITVGDVNYVTVTANAYRSPEDTHPGVGVAWEIVPGRTTFTKDSEIMNAETSAWGRAIVALGFKTKKIASQQEVVNRRPEEAEDFASRIKALGKNSKDIRAWAADQGYTLDKVINVRKFLNELEDTKQADLLAWAKR